jgi:hypothetical protein
VESTLSPPEKHRQIHGLEKGPVRCEDTCLSEVVSPGFDKASFIEKMLLFLLLASFGMAFRQYPEEVFEPKISMGLSRFELETSIEPVRLSVFTDRPRVEC